MEYKDLLFIVLAFVEGFIVWWMKVVHDSIKELRKSDIDTAAKIAAVEILLAGQYVRREELNKAFDTLFAKLDRIENKLDAKADKDG